MKKYEVLFFDLDHTLWDFEKNSREALHEIFIELNLGDHGLVPEDFIDTYEAINEKKWVAYRRGQISKDELRKTRFSDALAAYKVHHPELAGRLDSRYIEISPYKTHLFQDTIEVLTYLSSKYRLAIITNGFNETQSIKIRESKMVSFFEQMITSEDAGVNKPEPRIFTYALNQMKVHRREALMIGDNLEADIRGASGVGIDQVWFNPQGIFSPYFQPTHEIQRLNQLLEIL